MEMEPPNETLRTNPVAVAVAPLEQRHNVFTHALFPSDGSRRNGVQATPDMLAKETTLEGPTSKPAVRPSLCQNRQAKKASSLEKSVATGDSAETKSRDNASQGKLPCLAHQLVAGPRKMNS
jgi:hypothetical protein